MEDMKIKLYTMRALTREAFRSALIARSFSIFILVTFLNSDSDNENPGHVGMSKHKTGIISPIISLVTVFTLRKYTFKDCSTGTGASVRLLRS